MIVGILGGGQLGRMLALAGYPLDLHFSFIDPSPDAPVSALGKLTTGEYDDRAILDGFANEVDVVTYEFENVPVESARYLAGRVAVYPPPRALEVAQDRLVEKSFFRSHGIPTPTFAGVSDPAELAEAVKETGLPAILKTRRLGYDGKGQYLLRDEADIEAAWGALGQGDPQLILEGFVPFSRELSILAVRSNNGETAFYPLIENQHRDGILRISRAPAARITPELQAKAESYATLVLEDLGYVGVLAIELFEAEGELIANEMAPRVHNSGHWSIEGAETSQFENHLRAMLGMPLGSTAPVGCSAMINIIGKLPTSASSLLAIPGAHLHLYSKAERPNRKIGHITLRAPDAQTLEERITQVQALL